MGEKQFYIKCDDFNAWSVWEKGKDVIVFDLYKSDAQLVCDKLNELHDETQLLKDKLKKIDNVLPLYLSCAEIRDFHHDLFVEDMALTKHYRRRYTNE